MTRDQAEAIYILSSSPHWTKFIEYQNDKLKALHESLEWTKGDDIARRQGQCLEIRNTLNLKKAVDNIILDKK